MNDIIWTHICKREVESYKSPLAQRAWFEELAREGTPGFSNAPGGIPNPEAPRPVTPLQPCKARLKNLTSKTELNGVEVDVMGPSVVPGRISVRVPLRDGGGGSKKFLVNPAYLEPTDPDVEVLNIEVPSDALHQRHMAARVPVQNILSMDKRVNQMKFAGRVADQMGAKAVLTKGLSALYAEPKVGNTTPSIFSSRSASASQLPPRHMHLPPFPKNYKHEASMPAPPDMPLGTARVLLRERGESCPLEARRGRKGYVRNQHGGIWGKLT